MDKDDLVKKKMKEALEKDDDEEDAPQIVVMDGQTSQPSVLPDEVNKEIPEEHAGYSFFIFLNTSEVSFVYF